MTKVAVYVLSALAISALATARAADAAEVVKGENLALEQCPAAVQVAVAKVAENGALQGMRKVTKGTAVTYVADIAITLDSAGNVLKDGQPLPAVSAAGAAVAAKVVTVDCAATPLQDVCESLTKQAGVAVSCGSAFARKPVTLALKDATLAEVVQAIATQTGTRAELRNGGYRFRTGGGR